MSTSSSPSHVSRMRCLAKIDEVRRRALLLRVRGQHAIARAATLRTRSDRLAEKSAAEVAAKRGLKPRRCSVGTSPRPATWAGGPFGGGCDRLLRPALRVRRPTPLVRVVFSASAVDVLPSMESPHIGEATDRVKNAIKSLGHEFRQRSLKRAQQLYSPFPSFPVERGTQSWNLRRLVGRRGNTRRARETGSIFQTQTSYGKSAANPSRTHLAPWLLFAIAVVVTVGIIAARLQSSARSGVGHF